MTERQSELFSELPSYNKYVSDYPELVAEWHPTKNDNLLPEDIPHKVNYRLWWQCVVIASSSSKSLSNF